MPLVVTLAAALVFGLSLSVASTVVLLRALEARGALATPNGRIAVGWLVVEDLAMVLVLVLVPVLAQTVGPQRTSSLAALWPALGTTLLAVGGFVALMLLVGRRVLPWLLWQISGTGSREPFTLCVVAVVTLIIMVGKSVAAAALVVAGALLSIALNPALFSLVGPMRRAILSRSALARSLDACDDPLTELPAQTDAQLLAGHLVLVGHHGWLQALVPLLRERDMACVVVARERDRAEALRQAGHATVFGDVCEPATLVQAHVATAASLVIATHETTALRPIVEAARALNPGIRLVALAADEQAETYLRRAGVDPVLHERELLAERLAERLSAARHTP